MASSSAATEITCRAVQLAPLAETRAKHAADLAKIERYRRFVNYVSAAQIYLQANELLERPLAADDVKERLLGHWGTCPGINLVYAHCNRVIKQYDANMLFVTGPGHGAPAVLANVFAEGSLGEFYPQCPQTPEGAAHLIKAFSWPAGFPSHVNAETPGAIHEGGELGYALAVAYGAVMDIPDLIATCLVGDGEAESGPTAGAWHANKYLDPAESGAVLPILHVNGYKISEPTIYACMSNADLIALFTGYGYQVKIVDGFGGHMPEIATVDQSKLDYARMDLDADLYAAMDWAIAEIRAIQHAARSGNPISYPRFPLIILRSPKGWTGPHEWAGEPVEGSFRSHQVPVKDARTNKEMLRVLDQWLRSYQPEEMFARDGNGKWAFLPFLEDACPQGVRRMGCNPYTQNKCKQGRVPGAFEPLKLPNIFDYESPVDESARAKNHWSSNLDSATTVLGRFLRDVIRSNPTSFRIFSPDELESNKLQAVFEATHRNFQLPVGPFDSHIKAHAGGRVAEVLSEHLCQGWMQGYCLTGRYALFPSYEAFLGIIATMFDQYAKFLKMAVDLPWRGPYPSLVYLETSTLWRQEHNGFSHQNPGFINTMLNKKGAATRVYLPPDANTLVSTMHHCLSSTNKAQLVIAPKHDMPQWFTMEEAVAHCRAGASVMKWCSTEQGVRPDVVLVGIGGEMTIEVVAAAKIIAKKLPSMRVRVVNVTDLLILDNERNHPHGLSTAMFDSLFTADRDVIVNFHGYPSAVKQLLFTRDNTARFSIHGYQEEGTTTTPGMMCVVNETDRFHLVIDAVNRVIRRGLRPEIEVDASRVVSELEYVLRDHEAYTREHGNDSEMFLRYPDVAL